MAYAESTVGGTYGGSFRVWVNSIRTYYGNQSENFEEWRVEGGLNRISGTGGHIYNGYNNSSYTVQLGMNGVASSGNFSYDFGGGTGRMLAWGTGATRVYRDGAGNGFGFQSRMDINLNNSPYLTSGWVTSNDGVATLYRHATLTALSMDAGGVAAYDEGPMWLEFNNPSGTAVDAFIETPYAMGRIFTSGSVGSRYNFPFNGNLPALLQQSSPNSNTQTIRIGVHDSMGGDSWDWRDRTYTIKNDQGQANPTFSDFDYLDTNATTVAITGNNQILIQGLSTLQVNIPTTKKATPKKYATMQSYNVTIGGYVKNDPYASSSIVTDNVGTVSDVSGNQSLTVRAIDSRTNSTAVSKIVPVLAYFPPAIDPLITVGYKNNYDNTNGLTVTLPSNPNIATIAPMTFGGNDKNSVNPTSGVQFDLSKGGNTSYTGTWTNIAITQQANTGVITINSLSTLATNILTKMNVMGADNTTRWYVKFKIIDKLQTTFFETYIDVGKAIMRIGLDGKIYNNEQPLMPSHIGQVIFSTALDTAVKVQAIYGGTWAAFSKGRMLVGVDTTDTDFNAPNKIGGQKDLMAHSHFIPTYSGSPGGNQEVGGGSGQFSNGYDYTPQEPTTTTGTGVNNMNPYTTVYMWTRTA